MTKKHRRKNEKIISNINSTIFIFACSGKKEESVTAETKKTDAKVTVDIFNLKLKQKMHWKKQQKSTWQKIQM